MSKNKGIQMPGVMLDELRGCDYTNDERFQRNGNRFNNKKKRNQKDQLNRKDRRKQQRLEKKHKGKQVTVSLLSRNSELNPQIQVQVKSHPRTPKRSLPYKKKNYRSLLMMNFHLVISTNLTKMT